MQETNEMRDRLINEFAENYMEKLCAHLDVESARRRTLSPIAL